MAYGPTDKQVAFLRRLAGEAGADPERVAKCDFSGMNRGSDVDTLITELRRRAASAPKSQATAKVSSAPLPDVPEGRYAVAAADGHLVFYQVDRPTEGRWAGYVFVSQLVGAPGHWNEMRQSREQSASVLRRIAEAPDYGGVTGPMAAARLFGHTHKVCGKCSSPLSKLQSRAAGYGKVCADRVGWSYPSEAEARVMLAEYKVDVSDLDLEASDA